jgi:hypothetical protein
LFVFSKIHLSQALLLCNPYISDLFVYSYPELGYIEHRKTKVRHPWANGQVERMNRTLKEATVNNFHYASHDYAKATFA